MSPVLVRRLGAIAGALLVGLISVACGGTGVSDEPPLGDAWQEAVGDTIRDLISATQQAYESGNCETVADVPWLPDSPPLIYYGAMDQLIRLDTKEQIVGMCNSLASARVSVDEDIQEQSVTILSVDAAFVVTRSVVTTEWRDGRVEVQPTLETAIVARQGGRWRLIYKHLAWSAGAPERR